VGWYEFKQWLEISSGLHMDALHVHAGILCQLAAAFLLRRPLGSIWPWLVVAVAVTGNEIYDIQLDLWPNWDDQIREGVKDLWNTLLMPTLLMLVARYAPWLIAGRTESSTTDPA
jgi:hypothetical protein